MIMGGFYPATKPPRLAEWTGWRRVAVAYATPPATLAPVGHGRPLAARDRAHVLAVHVADHPDAPDRGAAAAGRAATPAPRGGHSERGAAPRGRSRRGLPPALPHAHPRRSWKR